RPARRGQDHAADRPHSGMDLRVVRPGRLGRLPRGIHRAHPPRTRQIIPPPPRGPRGHTPPPPPPPPHPTAPPPPPPPPPTPSPPPPCVRRPRPCRTRSPIRLSSPPSQTPRHGLTAPGPRRCQRLTPHYSRTVPPP